MSLDIKDFPCTSPLVSTVGGQTNAAACVKHKQLL